MQNGRHIRKLLWFAAWFTLIAPPPDLGQSSSKVGWGPWRYTWQDGEHWKEYWSGIPFRSKCVSNSGSDSKWAYQFRSRYSGTLDFVARVEHGVDGAVTNEFNRPEVFSLDGGALSPVFETVLHGTCEQLGEQKLGLKIEVICVTDPNRDREENNPCYQDENGMPLERKRNPNEKQN